MIAASSCSVSPSGSGRRVLRAKDNKSGWSVGLAADPVAAQGCNSAVSSNSHLHTGRASARPMASKLLNPGNQVCWLRLSSQNMASKTSFEMF